MFKINTLAAVLMPCLLSMSIYSAADIAMDAVGDMNVKWEAAEALWATAKNKLAEINQTDLFSTKERIKEEAHTIMLQGIKFLPVYVKNNSFFNKSITYTIEGMHFQRVVTIADFLYLGTGFGDTAIKVSIYGSKTAEYVKSDIEIFLHKAIDKLLELETFDHPALVIRLENLASSITEGLANTISRGQSALSGYLWSLFGKTASNVASSDGYGLEVVPNIEAIFQNMQMDAIFMQPNGTKMLQENIALLFPRINSRGRDVLKTAISYITPATKTDAMTFENASYILGLATDKGKFASREIDQIVESYSAMLRELLTAFNTKKLTSVSHNINMMINIIEDAARKVKNK